MPQNNAYGSKQKSQDRTKDIFVQKRAFWPIGNVINADAQRAGPIGYILSLDSSFPLTRMNTCLTLLKHLCICGVVISFMFC